MSNGASDQNSRPESEAKLPPGKTKQHRVSDAFYAVLLGKVKFVGWLVTLITLIFIATYPFIEPWNMAWKRMLFDLPGLLVFGGLTWAAEKDRLKASHVKAAVWITTTSWCLWAMYGLHANQDLLSALAHGFMIVVLSIFATSWRVFLGSSAAIIAWYSYAAPLALPSEKDLLDANVILIAGACIGLLAFAIRNAVMLRLVESEMEEKRQAEEARKQRDLAEEASQAKSRFLANMSHELRTPLHAIIGFSELLIEDKQVSPAGEKDINQVLKSSRHLMKLIDDLLDLSKVEAGFLKLKARTFSLNQLLQATVGELEPLATKRHNLLVLHPLDEDVTAYTDELRLRQCLTNLIGNASKFTKNGRITLGVETIWENDTEYLKFNIEDTGIGMTEPEVARVFAPFVQADDSTTRQYGGTGLGLAITKKLSNMLAGDLSVTSQEGEGSIFVLRIAKILKGVDGSSGEREREFFQAASQ